MGKRGRNKKGGKSRKRGSGFTKPVVLYVDLTPGSEATIMTASVNVQQALAGADAAYTYNLSALHIEIMAPAIITGTGGAGFCSVNMCTAQVYGFMQQDGTLQRNPLSTWRDLPTTKPAHFNFSKSYLKRRVYAGGFVPITNINDDQMFGIHALWKSGTPALSDSFQMQLTAKVRLTFSLGQDIQISAINSSFGRQMAEAHASFHVQPKCQILPRPSAKTDPWIVDKDERKLRSKLEKKQPDSEGWIKA